MRPIRRIARFLGLTRASPPEPSEVSRLARSVTEREERLAPIETAAYPFVPTPRLLQDYEGFYRRDGTIYGIVNRFVRAIVGVSITPIAPEDIIDDFTEWLNDPQVGFRECLRGIVQDVLVFGNAFVEMVSNPSLTDIRRLVRVDPKTMDFERDTVTQRVLLDEYGRPKRVVYTPLGLGSQKVMPKEIGVIDPETGKKTTSGFAHFTFTRTAGDILGVSPLETLYSLLKYKMNIENSLAEGLYRQTYSPIVIKVGREGEEPSPKVIDQIAEEMKDFHKKIALIVPYHFEIDRLEAARGRVPEGIIDFILYLDRLIREAYGTSIVEGKERIPEFERAVANYQAILEWQLQEEIFRPLARLRGWSSIPTIRFAQEAPESKLIESRSLAYLMRAGAITWDEELENYLRRNYGLPLLPSLTEEEREKRRRVQIRRRLEKDIIEEELDEHERGIG